MTTCWTNRYIAWSKLVAAYGANSTETQDPADGMLNTWLHRQRKLKKAGKLGEQEIEILEREGIDWSYGMDKPARKASKARDKTIDALIEYAKAESWIAAYNHVDWRRKASELRTAWKKNKLTEEQIAKLDAAGFDWFWQKTKTILTWKTNLAELDAYIARYGHANPRRHGDPHPKLANWVMWQREFHVKGELEDWKIQELKKRGVMLDPHWESFTRQAEALGAYVKENGTSIVPDGHPLDDFVRRCISQYRAGTLPPEKMDVLRNISFNFGYDRQKAKWFEHYDALCDFRLKHGHTNVTATQDAELNHFKDATRCAHKRGELADYRVLLMDSIGFQWSQRVRRTWDEVIGDLAVYKEEHGHLAISWKDELGQCANNLRSSYNRGDMPEPKIEQLNAIGFVWDLRVYKQALKNN